MSTEDVIRAWDTPDAPLHPLRGTDEYWESGKVWVGLVERYTEPEATVLDYGCGDGRVTKHLFEGFDAFGLDRGRSEIEAFEENFGPGRLVKPSSRRKFDTVVMLALLIHYNEEDGAEVLADAYKRVKSGGVLIANIRLGLVRQDTSWNRINVWTPEAIMDVTGVAFVDWLSAADDIVVIRKP